MPKLKKTYPVDISYFEKASWAHELDEYTLRTKINGGEAMSQADQQACSEAQQKGDYARVQEIIGKYETQGGSGGSASYSGGRGSYNTQGNTSSDGGNNGGQNQNPGAEYGGSNNSGTSPTIEVPNEYYVASDRALFSLNGLKEIECNGETFLAVYCGDTIEYNKAADYHFFTGKYGAAGNKTTNGIAILNDKGEIIHIVKSDSGIENLRKDINNGSLNGIWNQKYKTSMNLYEGQYTVAPTLFNQLQFTKELGFASDFSKTACFATAILNNVSTQYTNETGKKLSFEDGMEALRFTAQENKYILTNNARIKDYAGAANSMIQYIEKKYNDTTLFEGTFSYNYSNNSIKYSINKTELRTDVNHFTNDLGPIIGSNNLRSCYDTLTGHIKTSPVNSSISAYYNYDKK